MRGIGARIRAARELTQCIAAAEAEMSVRVIPYGDLVQKAGGKDEPRVLVNYLRHEATQYESLCDRHPRAHAAIKCRALDIIADAYPYLREECDRQAEELLAAT